MGAARRGSPGTTRRRADGRASGSVTVTEVRGPDEVRLARALVEEYAGSLGLDLSFQGFAEELSNFPEEYGPPSGALLLARDDGDPAGVVGLRRFAASVCEMKRLYVRPAVRGRGIGGALVAQVVLKAKELGYACMRLDTLPTMEAAVGLYLRFGFREIAPYRYNPVAGARFFELDLRGVDHRTSRPAPG